MQSHPYRRPKRECGILHLHPQAAWISRGRCSCGSMNTRTASLGAGNWGHVGAAQTAHPFEPHCSTAKDAHERGMQARTCTGSDAWARTGFKSKLAPEEAPRSVQRPLPVRITVSARGIAGTRATKYQRRLRVQPRSGSSPMLGVPESGSIRSGNWRSGLLVGSGTRSFAASSCSWSRSHPRGLSDRHARHAHADDQRGHHTRGYRAAFGTLTSNPARAPLARSSCASPIPAPPPGSSP